jgi:glycosyltransferase involved in cell wall biosynthesis
MLQDVSDWQLVVVDNGSTDDTGEILNRFRQQFKRPFEIVNEPKAGLGRARNAGWRMSCGRVVAFTDDDCYPAQDYCQRVLECFDGNDIGFIGGRILLYDNADCPTTIQTLDRFVELPPREFVPAGLIQGANFAFRRSALELVNGFDDRMGAGTPFACEDVDILARLSSRGVRGAYCPQPLVYHHHRRRTEAEVCKLVKTYDYGRGAYYAKCLLNPGLRRVYSKQLWKRLGSKSAITNAREVAGAVHFLFHSLFEGP